MGIFVFENTIENKTSFVKAPSQQEAVKLFKRIYSHLSVYIPSLVREILPEEKIVLDDKTGELHCIGDNNKANDCLLNLMCFYSPVDWVPPIHTCEVEEHESLSFSVHSSCFEEDNEGYNEEGIKAWEHVLRVKLDNDSAFWNALQRFLHIRMVSISALEKLVG
ncbi:hypothetical protein COO03_04630 [Bacillus sp. AFS098217]|uniref:hypothetical protein n=1 Tax=Bacillus sp. AFS098217 TaxID=2033868 RepID=UPI000BEBB576|nr:hypothetical protein [Bacillus sp. AFS098217]PEB54535.1 hypothetical protein COO03_04630 [Bacillus sp. AFS098217]